MRGLRGAGRRRGSPPHSPASPRRLSSSSGSSHPRAQGRRESYNPQLAKARTSQGRTAAEEECLSPEGNLAWDGSLRGGRMRRQRLWNLSRETWEVSSAPNGPQAPCRLKSVSHVHSHCSLSPPSADGIHVPLFLRPPKPQVREILIKPSSQGQGGRRGRDSGGFTSRSPCNNQLG